MSQHASSRPESDALSSAIEAARQNPANTESWDLVEELVDDVQRPSDVRELFRDVLNAGGLPSELVTEVGQRAVRFYEAWYNDDSTELAELLTRVLERDGRADWAFERLSVVLTSAGRFEELLAAYDKQIAHESDTLRRIKLLEEAAQLAKDFASQPDRAIAYMTELLPLDPDNAGLMNALERLLERQNRWSDLIGMWRSRVSAQPPRQQRDTYLRMASCYLDALQDPSGAMRDLEHVLAEAPDYQPALDLAERILAAPNTTSTERTNALRYLREHFLRKQQPHEVVRVLELALSLTPQAERRTLLRELVERLVDLREDARAATYQAQLLVLDPLPPERDALRALTERTRGYEQYAIALVDAAAACNEPNLRVELLMEAARLREETLGDVNTAIEYYGQVFRADASAAVTIDSGRKLLRLLSQTDRERETLDVLARMSQIEPVDAARKALLGRLAQLAEKLGDHERARQAWNLRVGNDSNDLEALEALIQAATREQDYATLAKLLRQRTESPGAAHQRRDDLAQLARIYDENLHDLETAIATWRELRQDYGEDDAAVSALTVLLSRAERWDELADILREAAQSEVQHFTELQTNLGDAYRTRLGKPELAVLRYRSVLQVDPAHAAARAGQTALLSLPECRAIAVASLSEAYRQTGEWQMELSLLETRLLTTESEDKRAELLLGAAREWENLGQDRERALECYRRAFTLAPNDRETEREIRRLAAQLDRWDVVIAAYRETIATFTQPTPRMAELRFEEAQILENRLGDKNGALEAYAQAAAIVPQREQFASAAARVAAELQQWSRAARELTLSAAAKGGMKDVPFEAVDRQAEAANAMQAFCDGLDACLSDTSLQLPASLRRSLLRYLAGLQRDKRNDLRAAESAYERALLLDERDHETLQALCATQRTLGSAGLLPTLRNLAEIERDNLDQLWEAALLAHSSSEQHAVLDALYQRSAALWRRGRAPSGLRNVADACAFAIERTCQLYHAEGQPDRALSLLIEATRLPFDAAAHARFMHEAAALALKLPGAAPRAISLYQEILQQEPSDHEAIGALATLYAQADRLPELLALRRHELTLDPKGPARLSLRLEIVRLLGEIEARGDRKSALHENLAEQPGHRASLDALSELLRQRGQFAELTQIFEAQARTLTSHGHRAQAAWLWREIAALRERELSDPRAALLAHREVHELEPTSDASAALARLYTSLNEHALAAEWLEIRLGSAPEELRAETAVALAKAHLAAGQNTQARACLEQTLVEHPQLNMAREMLAKLYREDSAYEPLALVLSQGADAQTDPERRLAYLREAADLYCEKLNVPERAIPVLERATALAPDDTRLRSMLAEGLRVAGRYEEAKNVLRALIEGFGRKRSPERAEFHYQLARVAASARQFDEAFAELEHATKMDLGHQAALHMLASLAQQQGDLDRAERSYRALLLLLRRQKNEAPEALGQAEVLYELYRLSEARNQPSSAAELLASAMEVASQSELEAKRFSRVLRERGATELLLRVLDKRLAGAKEPKLEAEILGEKAEVLEREQAQTGAALDLRLRAVQLDDQNEALHTAALALATRADGLPRYLDLLGKLADDAARSRAPKAASVQARHLLRLARAVEREQRDFERAASIYAKVEASGEHTVEAWLGMARVAGARGDNNEQRRVLLRVADLPDAQASAADRKAARFALAELELQEPAWRNEGVETLQRALNESQDYGRAKQVLTQALERAPDHTGVLALCERVARVSQDEPLLLSCIERRALLKGAQLSDVREGIEIALRRRDLVRAERLLERARTLYQADSSLTDDPTWVFSGLAQCRLQAKDTRGAMQYLREAVAHAPESEAQTLARELAELASGPDGDLTIAYETYARMLEREPADRSLWEPALNVLMRMGDRQELPNFVNRTLASLLMLEDRLYLLQTYANQLLQWGEDQPAADVLGQILEEEPAHLEATNQLLSIYEKHGMQSELMGLMQQQFDRARDERNVEAIVELGLRLGNLYAHTSAHLACDVLRAALDWQPESHALLKALLQHMPQESDPRERGEIMMRLLRTESGAAAAQLSLELATHFEQLNDEDRMREALEQGYRAHPEQPGLRERLESFYATRELYRPMAELMEFEATRLGNSVAAIASLRNAAAIYRDQLQDTDAAAGALRAALALSPTDMTLLNELVQSLANAGQHNAAIEDVTRHLSAHTERDEARSSMLRVRAQLLSTSGQAIEALQDMEEAYAITGPALGDELLSALAEARDVARDTGAHAVVRQTSLRLVELLDAQGDPERARHELAQLCEAYPDDIAALLRLRDRDMQEQRYEEAAGTSQRLIELTEGEPRVAATLILAEAYDKLGQSEAALPWLARVHAEAPDVIQLRDRLRLLYERTGDQRELAVLLMGDAEYHSDPAEKLACWQRAAEIFISLGDSESAIEPLQKATEVAPEDDRTRLLLIDIDLSLGRVDTAAEHIEAAINSHKRRRSPELAQLQQRMARVSAARGDTESQLKWLNTALDTDRKSGEIASELVEAALACGDHETAMKALRTLTMMEDPRPITRALAFLKQAEIAMVKGDIQRAQHWARKAKSLDESLQEADDLLAKLGV